MKYVWDNDRQEFVADVRDRMHHHYVMNDIEFRSTDGANIGSRSVWREHLKRTGNVEMGHSDLKNQKDQWESRKSSHADRTKNAEKLNIRPVDMPAPSSDNYYERSMLNREVLNRLDGRPAPDRKMLLKTVLEVNRLIRNR